jgi:hypothetical protein
MASPGAATLSVQRSSKVASQTVLVVSVMALVAALAFLLATMEDFTSPITWRGHVVAAHPEPAQDKTGSRWQLASASATNREQVPAALARHRMISRAWHATASVRWTGEKSPSDGAAERSDFRRDLVDMAAAQRRHWTPRNASTGHDNIASEDRIANALFGS